MGEMKHTAHTPGPWSVTIRDRIGITVRAADGKPVADIWQNGDDPDATAHLIAAAPEMQEALEGIVHFSDAVAYRDDPLSKALRGWINAGRAALSKAEGRSLSSASGQEADHG